MDISYNEFIDLTTDILKHPEFLKLKDIVHHGMNRYDHSFRVAFASYGVTKLLKLNYQDAARAALLHDFFLEENENVRIQERIKTLYRHPSYAVDNSSKYFELSELQKDIIEAHMFPVNIKIPKYLESWIVDLVDDCVSIYERFFGLRKQIYYASSFLIVLFMNHWK